MFYIYILDNESPVFIELPKNSKEFPVDTGKNTAYLTTLTLDVTDNCGIANQTCQPRAPQTFEIGDTEVTCTAYDVNGNRMIHTYTITIVGKLDLQIFVSNNDNCIQVLIAI